MKRAQKLFGQKMHVFDIRKHEMARADAFYQPKPGTDLVWLGALLNISLTTIYTIKLS